MREFRGSCACRACRLESVVLQLVSFAASSWVNTGFDGLPQLVGMLKCMFREFSSFAVVAKLADAHA